MTPASDIIAWFPDIGLADRPLVGGKAASLGELTGAGLPVPEGFVIRTTAFDDFLWVLGLGDRIRARVAQVDVEDLEAVTSLSQSARAEIEGAELPVGLLAEIAAAHQRLSPANQDIPLAVRSSATAEDTDAASFAGLQDTDLWVKGHAAVLSSVRRCWSSFYSVEAICYRRRHALPESGAMAVVVQRMVDARTAGVMFTQSPLSGDRSVIAIEGAWGLGSAIVGGEVTPDRWVVGKITGEIQLREISDKHIWHIPASPTGIEAAATPESLRLAPCLTDPELLSLRQIARAADRHFGSGQDIEWAVDTAGQIFVLQSRPITTRAKATAEPLARPRSNPIEHVMAVFGGRPKAEPASAPTPSSSLRGPAV